VFKLNIDGSGFTTLHTFTAVTLNPTVWSYTNEDGAYPYLGLVLLENTLHGTTVSGGITGRGVLFAIKTDGTGFSTLSNGDVDGLIVSGDSLFVTAAGLSSPTVVKYDTDGTLVQFLYDKGVGTDSFFWWSGLAVSGDTLYCTLGRTDPPDGLKGSTQTTVLALLAIKTDGSGYETLESSCVACGTGLGGGGLGGGLGPGGGLSGADDSVGWPLAVAVSDNTLYGLGGANTILGRFFQPSLRINSSQSNTVLSWPTNYAGFDYTGYTLESTPNLGSPTWTSNLPYPLILNGQKTVTVPVTNRQQFFRLIE
jgi:hypothetical protein